MALVAIILVQINIQLPKVQILFANDITVVIYENSRLVILVPTPKVGQPVADSMIFDIQFLQIPICRANYLSQILAFLWGMEDNGRMKYFLRFVILMFNCDSQRYEKNRKNRPDGRMFFQKKRADTSRHPIATCLPSADFPLPGKAARLLSCGHERRSAGSDQRFRR